MAASCRAMVACVALALSVSAQYYNNDYTTPVPILKQINRHNEDGSYSYGYEGADGSFKIETKHPTGEVYGKYGYVDDTGSVREVEYGASRRGFEPTGAGINVPPPTLQNNYVASNAYGNDYDDGQYHEDPSVYHKNEQYNSRPRFGSAPQQYSPPPQQQYNPPSQQHYNPPSQQHYNPPPQQHYNPPSQQYRQAPAQGDYNQFRGHPASKFDVSSGSYSVSYSG